MSVANSYAKALYEAAIEKKATSDVLNKLEEEMDLLYSTLSASKEAKVALYGPITTAKEKGALLEELCKQLHLSDLAIQFALLLAKKGRLSLLPQIRDTFNSFRLMVEGGIAGRLVAADSMNELDIGTLAKAFSQKLGKKVAFRVSTDPSLLAGMKVTVNGVTYDGTLRSQLQKLRDRFVTGLPGAHA